MPLHGSYFLLASVWTVRKDLKELKSSILAVRHGVSVLSVGRSTLGNGNLEEKSGKLWVFEKENCICQQDGSEGDLVEERLDDKQSTGCNYAESKHQVMQSTCYFKVSRACLRFHSHRRSIYKQLYSLQSYVSIVPIQLHQQSYQQYKNQR